MGGGLQTLLLHGGLLRVLCCPPAVCPWHLTHSPKKPTRPPRGVSATGPTSPLAPSFPSRSWHGGTPNRPPRKRRNRTTITATTIPRPANHLCGSPSSRSPLTAPILRRQGTHRSGAATPPLRLGCGGVEIRLSGLGLAPSLAVKFGKLLLMLQI